MKGCLRYCVWNQKKPYLDIFLDRAGLEEEGAGGTCDLSLLEVWLSIFKD